MKILPIFSKLYRSIAISLLIFLFLSAFAPTAQAFVDTSQESFERAVTSDQYNIQSFDFQTFGGLTSSITTSILGCSTTDVDVKEKCVEMLGISAVEGTGLMIAALYATPPASGVQYLADVSSRLGIAKPVYAQEGIGFRGLAPILPIWKAFRDLAYLFFVVIFVVMGFAIMFRVKISPQAVITIQSALPRIVVALLLVTFSYAIAGFLIDFMYVVIFLLSSIFQGAMLKNWPELRDILERLYSVGTDYYALLKLFGSFAVLTVVSVIKLGALFGPIPLLGLIFAIVILFTMLRIIFVLLMAYVRIVVSVALAPLQIMLDVIPGQSGFGGWLRNLLSNVAVFPTVAAMFFLAGFFLSQGPFPSLNILDQIKNFIDLIQGLATLEGAATFVWSALSWAAQPLIGLGILLMTPKAADMVRDALQIKPLPYGAAIGEAFGPVRTMAAPTVAGVGELLIGRRFQRLPGAPPSAAERGLTAALDALVKQLQKR